jgi:hypothetical protein
MAGLLDNEEEVNAQIEAVLSDDQGEYDHMIPDRAILKMLVTDNIAGAIIGKNGKAIADLQDECGARIKVSQSADFYPGTSERTILITGLKSPLLDVSLSPRNWKSCSSRARPYLAKDCAGIPLSVLLLPFPHFTLQLVSSTDLTLTEWNQILILFLERF